MTNSQKSQGLLLVLAYVGFISLGLPDTVVGIAWPFVRDGFHLGQSSLGWVLIGASCGYFVSSTSTGRVLGWLRVGGLLAASSGLVAISGFGFASAPVWPVFLAFSVLHGLGSGAIDAALNYYVARHFSARHMNWLHACYSLGATIGPLVMTSAIAASGSWRHGYLAVGGTMLVLSLLFTSTRQLWGREQGGAGEPEHTASTDLGEALRHPVVWIQALFFLIYTGLEVTAGQWSFTLLTESRGFGEKAAGFWVSSYWASIGVGRVIFGFAVERVEIDRLLRVCLATAVLGTAVFAWSPAPSVGPVGLIITGLSLAPIYPCMMTRTPQRLGAALAAHAIGLQVGCAMIGAALLPGLTGWIAQQQGLERIGLAAVLLAAGLFLLHETLLLQGRLRATQAA